MWCGGQSFIIILSSYDLVATQATELGAFIVWQKQQIKIESVANTFVFLVIWLLI